MRLHTVLCGGLAGPLYALMQRLMKWYWASEHLLFERYLSNKQAEPVLRVSQPRRRKSDAEPAREFEELTFGIKKFIKTVY